MLMLEEEERARLWQRLVADIEAYAREVESLNVSPALAPERVRAAIEQLDFAEPRAALEVLEHVVGALREFQVHTPHPRYFGLFNPAPTTISIAADALVAAFNPQLAAWSHNPFANEVERYLVRSFGERFGYDPSQADGAFASGGAEANHTALLVALLHASPSVGAEGLRALTSQPVFYVSAESHHSFLKAARLSGLGTNAVREIAVDEQLRMRPDALDAQIQDDLKAGYAPFMVVATVGTTNSGAIDPLAELSDIATRRQLWCHVDAAWGGAAVLLPEFAELRRAIARADSITFDAHKWLSVPMGAGLFLTRHADVMDRTFRVANAYMPRESEEFQAVDPYAHSMQWSRRFIGLKVFMSLAVAGWRGYAEAIRHQTEMGNLLRRALEESNWHIVNDTPLPVACFLDATRTKSADDREAAAHLTSLAREVVASGRAWISTTRLGNGLSVLRACITNYRTQPEHVKALVETLNQARRKLSGAA